MRKSQSKRLLLPVLLLATISINAHGYDVNHASSLDQAAYVTGSSVYDYGHNSIPNISVTGAPDDTDFTRWAMLHDGSTYRLYFFRANSNAQIYQFGYNPASSAYEFGFNSIPVIDITGAPADADPGSFAMLHDGRTYRLYMRGIDNPQSLYQFGFNSRTSDYEFGFNSIPVINITGAPADANFDGWAMLHDGSNYRLYAFNKSAPESLYQFAYNGSTYAYGFNSINVLTVTDMPDGSHKDDFAMLHDGSNYRFYYTR